MPSNAERVTMWMGSIGQDTPDEPGWPTAKTVNLRSELIGEEATEVEDELGTAAFMLQEKVFQDPNNEDMARAVKELADLLVVTYGTFTALGVDANEVFNIVMNENDAKVQHAEDRGDGKMVVPEAKKQELKAETKQRLEELLAQE